MELPRNRRSSLAPLVSLEEALNTVRKDTESELSQWWMLNDQQQVNNIQDCCNQFLEDPDQKRLKDDCAKSTQRAGGAVKVCQRLGDKATRAFELAIAEVDEYLDYRQHLAHHGQRMDLLLDRSCAPEDDPVSARLDSEDRSSPSPARKSCISGKSSASAQASGSATEIQRLPSLMKGPLRATTALRKAGRAVMAAGALQKGLKV